MASGYRPAKRHHLIAFAPLGEAIPLRLRLGRGAIGLIVSFWYEIEREVGSLGGGWAVRNVAFSYEVLDRAGQELVVYHWHPIFKGPEFPHLHLSSRIGDLPLDGDGAVVALGDMHLPTGFVPFAAVVRLLIAEFGAAPRRDDWEEVVAGSNQERLPS